MKTRGQPLQTRATSRPSQATAQYALTWCCSSRCPRRAPCGPARRWTRHTRRSAPPRHRPAAGGPAHSRLHGVNVGVWVGGWRGRACVGGAGRMYGLCIGQARTHAHTRAAHTTHPGRWRRWPARAAAWRPSGTRSRGPAPRGRAHRPLRTAGNRRPPREPAPPHCVCACVCVRACRRVCMSVRVCLYDAQGSVCRPVCTYMHAHPLINSLWRDVGAQDVVAVLLDHRAAQIGPQQLVRHRRTV
jgi:hypothetical protein